MWAFDRRVRGRSAECAARSGFGEKVRFFGGPGKSSSARFTDKRFEPKKKPLEGFDPLYPRSVSTEPRKSSIGG
jgi:hypothetical protein